MHNACIQRPVPPTLSELRTEAVCYFFRHSELFNNVAEHHLIDLANASSTRSLEKGAYLFHKNDVAPGLYLVRRGIINFHRVAMDGREIVIHFYREGEHLAEIGSKAGLGVPADACAVVPSEVIVISWRSFMAKIRECQELASNFLLSMDRQFHQMADSLESFVTKNADLRFVQWLLQQCQDQFSQQSVEINLGMTKRALAGEIGVRQETLSRMIRLLSDAGHLNVEGGHFTIRSPHALRAAWFPRYNTCAAAA